MKILIFNWRDIKNPLSGGAEISLFEHAKYWQRRGAEVTWFAASFKGAKSIEKVEEINIIRKGSPYTVHLWGYVNFISGKFGKPDLVVDSFHGIPFFSILYIPKSKIIALINEIAGRIWFVNTNSIIASTGYVLEKLSFSLYKSIPFITGSSSAKDELIKVGLPEQNITVVNHGTHILKLPAGIQKENKPTILFLGRVAVDKGIADALQAFRDIKQQLPDAMLWIAGGEERKGIVNELIAKFASSERNNITYYGFVSEQKKFELLKKSWLLVHPSYKEGWGLTVIEAASQGVPTIGYKVAGLIDSVQDGKTGILVEPKNRSELAQAAITLIHDKKAYKNFSENAVQWSKQFSWDVSVKKSWEIVNNVYKKNAK